MVDSFSGDPPPEEELDPDEFEKPHDPANQDFRGDHAAGGAQDSPQHFVGGVGMLRFAGAGLELGGSAILGAAIGYALDRYLENTTLVATALGVVFGFAAGLYQFIRMAMAANRSTGRR